MASEDSESVYLYEIPLESDGIADSPAYTTPSDGNRYLTHYKSDALYIIREEAAGYLHRSDMNVGVRELDKEEVENSDDLVEDFI